MQDTAERSKNELMSDVLLWTVYTDVKVLADQQEIIYNCSVRKQDVVEKNSRKW